MIRMIFEDVVKKYNTLIEETRRFDCLVRDTDLQKKQIYKLSEFKRSIKVFKRNEAANHNEKKANLFFHFQCVLNANISSLNMYISLKEKDYYKAWDFLMDSQEYLIYALKAENEWCYGVKEYLERQKSIESYIFPGFPLYYSIGLTFKGGVCSICNKPLEKCEHIEEKIYWGRICKRIKIREVDCNHVALVTKPKDRRCILTKIEDDEGMRDYMTWQIVGEKPMKSEKTAHIEGRVYNNKSLDLF